MQIDPVVITNLAMALCGDLSKTNRMTAFTRAACGNNMVLHVAFDFYESAKGRMLAAKPWQGTRKRKALTVSADDPLIDGKWAYKYVRPPDCLILEKVVDTNDAEYPYEVAIEEDANLKNVRWVYCNEADVYAKYIVAVGEETYLPGMERLHALYLAEDIISTVISDPVKAALMMDRLRKRTTEFMAEGLKEGYVENEQGQRQYVDLY
jgi:hypothetical protein